MKNINTIIRTSINFFQRLGTIRPLINEQIIRDRTSNNNIKINSYTYWGR